MQGHGQAGSHLPEGTREATFLIFDKENGAILHGHHSVWLPFDNQTVDRPGERDALEIASHVLRRDQSELGVITVRPDELQAGARYRVDTHQGRLERVDPI
jgi:hypothetical protein